MTRFPLGAACVTEGEKLLGIVTDGDLRRALTENENLQQLSVEKIMTKSPQTIASEILLGDALKVTNIHCYLQLVDLMQNIFALMDKF